MLTCCLWSMCPVARLNFGCYISTHTCSFSRISVTTTVLSQVQFSLFLFPLGVTTADHLPPYHLCMSSFMTSTNLLFLFLQHPLSSICTIAPLHMSEPSQPCVSNFELFLWCTFICSMGCFHLLCCQLCGHTKAGYLRKDLLIKKSI